MVSIPLEALFCLELDHSTSSDHFSDHVMGLSTELFCIPFDGLIIVSCSRYMAYIMDTNEEERVKVYY